MKPSLPSFDLPPALAFVARLGRRLVLGIVLLLAAAVVLEISARFFLPERSSRYLIAGESNGAAAWIDNPFFPYRFVSARAAKLPPSWR